MPEESPGSDGRKVGRMTEDVRKLLGGYATGTLTEDEKKELFDAALYDDALFAALADEQALKELLDDSAVRAQVLQATENPRFSVIGALREWFEHPKAKALVATGAVLLAIIGVNQVKQAEHSSTTTTVAELRRPVETPAFPAPSAPRSETADKQAKQESANTPLAAGPASQRQTALADKLQERSTAVRETEQQKAVAVQEAAAPPPPPPAAAAPARDAQASSAAAGAAAGNLAVVSPEMRSTDATQSFAASSRQSPRARVGALQRAAGTSVTPLRYELLRQDAAGAFQAVPTDYLFAPGDIVRVRVTSSRDGAVGVSSNTTNATVSRAVAANVWTEVPQSGGIAITAETARLVIAFAPSPTDGLTSNLLESDEARAKRVAAPPVSLEIPIRQKKP
jgi:hypothetical protein